MVEAQPEYLPDNEYLFSGLPYHMRLEMPGKGRTEIRFPQLHPEQREVMWGCALMIDVARIFQSER